MNRCTFLGKIIKPVSLINENGIEKVEILLQIENKRKSKSDIKKMDYELLLFEAWGTAAITIAANLANDDYLLIIDSTARTIKDSVCFRINEFKIIKRGMHEYKS